MTTWPRAARLGDLLAGGVQGGNLDKSELQEVRDFLHQVNVGGEFLSTEQAERIRQLAKIPLRGADGRSRNLLTEDEVKNRNNFV